MFTFKKAPVTVTLVAILWVLFLVDWLVGGVPFVLSSGLTAASLGGAVALTLVAVLAYPAERILGSVKYFVTGLIAQLASLPVAVFVARVIERLGLWEWGGTLLRHNHVSPIGFLVGSAGFASAFMPRLWRRRVRVGILALTLTMVFYSGSFSDLVGATAAVLGVAVGMVATSERPRRTASVGEKRVLTALFVGSVAIGPLLVALNPNSRGPFSSVTRLMWASDLSEFQAAAECHDSAASQACIDAMDFTRVYGLGPAVANLIPLVIQLVLCFGLLRGRRLAWWVSGVVQVLVMAVLLVQLFDFDADGINLDGVNLAAVIVPWLGCLAVLWSNRGAFGVRESARLVRRAAVRIAFMLVICAAVWIFGAYLLRGDFDGGASLSDILLEAPLRLLPPIVSLLLPYSLVPTTAAAWALYEWVGTALWLVVAWTAYRMFASPADPDKDDARARARAILEAGSGDHLSFMTLWPGNRYFFNEAGTTYVAYRASNGIALSLGEPVGADVPGCAAEFEAFAHEQALRPAWYSVRSTFARPGYKTLEVAEEAVLTTDNIEFKGKSFQNVRTARNKAAKEGITTVWTTWPELDRATAHKIVELSEDWVADKALPEMGFTLGGLQEMRVSGTRLLLALDEDGQLHGVTSWMPVRTDGALVGYTLDVMRRREGGFKGVIELLISEALIIAAREGCQWISLSGAPLAGSPDEPGLLDALLSRLGQEMEPLYGFRTLAASKRKFQPEEHAWYLGYDDELALPAIGLAVAHAYVPTLRAADAARAVRTWAAARRDNGK
ncbi:phosphatidylglycerol lysyltransferase domain-containing protein [uncultured Corynebacterium sp.]|uniref:bifunctional lysylphosphatidylglycerol flippase/synthetase MprF n=1 Tax=uncultured Corynebacterium sp. TaxID=159447 RepID=UPI0025E0D016|nr:phosphatidylglycerol lysyltransferase domain-containing protein [uncultured Corynebacterium sp.]